MTVSTTHDGRSLPALEAFDFPVGLVLTGDGQVLAEAGETDEVFPFASVTKPIVAWSALVAVDRGLLSLDDPATPASSGDGGGAGGSDDGGARAGHQVALPGASPLTPTPSWPRRRDDAFTPTAASRSWGSASSRPRARRWRSGWRPPCWSRWGWRA